MKEEEASHVSVGSQPSFKCSDPNPNSNLTTHSFIMASASSSPSSSSSSTVTQPSSYNLQTNRMKILKDPSKQPVALVACGSFSPITFAHMRMFEMAQDYCRQNTNFEVVAGYLSPVGDGYRKIGLVSASRR